MLLDLLSAVSMAPMAWEIIGWGAGTLQPASSSTAGPCAGLPWAAHQHGGAAKELPQAQERLLQPKSLIFTSTEYN